ncbi:MAG: pentapeptide repeat-containing protein [Chloroflexi bacterium]|nr:pentapeptide repeat-containing protein [Chloroflexota bacterium]MDE2649265.1 pentapeptide repeat-containing protein [Chloroflexota bacterium]
MGRHEEIRNTYVEYRWFYKLLGGVSLLITGVLLGILIGEARFQDYLPEFHLNVWTEALGVFASAGFTVFIIDQLYDRRNRRELKRKLVRSVRSPSHDVAINAISELDHYGWLTGDSAALRGADLMEAKLDGARLNGVNLAEAILERAELNKTKLIKASLQGAILTSAKLHNSKLNEADLRNAKCHGVEMPNVRLGGACLEGTDLSYSCLEGAGLQRACFNDADLHDAKLKGAFLWDTDFNNANLVFADLREATYHKRANWKKAKLGYTNLKGVDFSEANMKGVDLECTNLEGAILDGTDLQGANLKGARLKGASFRAHSFTIYTFAGDMSPNFEDLPNSKIVPKTNLVGATLPDGKVFTEEMDFSYLHRFTNEKNELFEPILDALAAYCDRP